MGYPTKLLNPGEQLAVDVRPHWKYLAGPALAMIIALAGAIAALVAQIPQWAELAVAARTCGVRGVAGRPLPPVGHDFVRRDQRAARPA